MKLYTSIHWQKWTKCQANQKGEKSDNFLNKALKEEPLESKLAL